ncbi:hypothetical protein BTVI_114009 [Pitangus sulphuratus]|nr:hypothetical protein BTVI_114009 [Pitangus sulphuratus]
MDSGTECTLSKSANDTKLCGAVNKLKGRDAIQRDLERLKRWACANLMKCKMANYKVLQLGQGNPKHQNRLGGEQFESSSEEDLGLLADEKLIMTQQCAFAAQKATCTLGSTKRSVARKGREVIPPFYSVPMRPHLKYCVQLWGPHHNKDPLEPVQREAMKMIRGLEHLSFEDRLRVQSGEKKALGRPYSSLPVSEESLQESQRGTFYWSM